MAKQIHPLDSEKIQMIFKQNQGPEVRQALEQYIATDVYPLGSCGSEERRREKIGLAFDSAMRRARSRGCIELCHSNARINASAWPQEKKEKFRTYFLGGASVAEIFQDPLFKADGDSFASFDGAFNSFTQSLGITVQDRKTRRETVKGMKKSEVADPKDEFPVQAFVDFLGLSRTMREICDKFSKDKPFMENIFSHLPAGYRFYTQRNAQGDTTYVILKDHLSGTIGENIWTCRQAPGQPYLLIEFPESFDLNKIKVLPLADIWFGDNLHEKERFDEYVQWIFNTEEAFAVLNGNVFRAFRGGEEEKDNLYATYVAFTEKIRPIAHKILWAISGQNEAQSARSFYDPLDIVCQDLGIRHFTEPVYADIVWKGNIFTFFCFAGTTFAQTKGGKINAAIRPMHFQEMVNFIIMGKAKDKTVMKQPRIRRDPLRFKLVYEEQFIVICSSFKKYFGSEEARRGYQPPSWGTVSCNLFPDGSCEYSS